MAGAPDFDIPVGTTQELHKLRSFWITFSIPREGKSIQGDLFVDTNRLDVAFLRDVKQQIIRAFIEHNGGTLIPGLGEPVIVACIPLDDK